jgi:GNAT superfamily N-acetyltransferase
MDVEIRAADADQMRFFEEWAQREGWGAGRGDAASFHDADPGGFLLAWADERPVGSISAVRYDDAYSFVGYYIVDPGLRGRGIGHQIFDAALERIGPAASGLDGVEEQVATYASLGYVPAHLTKRYVGSAQDISAALAGRAMPVDDVGPADIEALIDYDEEHVPARREQFVRTWLAPDSARMSYVIGRGSDVRGYATVRPMIGGGSRIGPLFAKDEDSALSLLSACAVTAASWGDDLVIDIPAPHQAAVTLAESLGMVSTFACTRMYRGDVRPLPLERIWGSTSFELG